MLIQLFNPMIVACLRTANGVGRCVVVSGMSDAASSPYHVLVAQSLLDRGVDVHVLADGVSSSDSSEIPIALDVGVATRLL